MTGNQLLDNALAMLMTSSEISADYGAYALPLINMLLTETAPYNEMVCLRKEKEAPTELLQIESMGEELPCELELAVMVLPYGLCAKLLMDDDDMAKVAWFSNQFLAAAEACAGVVMDRVQDCYPKGAVE